MAYLLVTRCISRHIKSITITICLLCALPAHAITVVASLPALSMVADQLLQGVGKSIVLVDGRQSPHGMALSPSQRQALAQADLVLWIGSGMESWLVKPLQTMQKNNLAVTDLPQIGFLPATLAQNEASQHNGHGHEQGIWDMHLWLDPNIMLRYGIALADELMLRDPKHSERYAQNLAEFRETLEQAIVESRQILTPLSETPLLTTHDAWRYFFKFFNLRQGGVLQRTPDEAAQMHTLTVLERQLISGNVKCILREPQVDTKIIAWLKQRAPNLIEALTDPLGQANYIGGYPQWLLDQANEIARCRVQ